jgi:benzaldehyde dehydrogenase (NAD)
LGGNNPYVVLDDADVESAARAGAYGSFTHQGQICMAIGRHLVAESIVDEYVDNLAAIAETLTVGDPTDDVDLGPVINQTQVDHIDDVVRRSIDAGAEVRAGAMYDRLFVRPTVLASVSREMPAFTEEIFGPVAPVTTFANDDEAVDLANATPFGLVAAVRSRSVRRALSVGDRLDVGMVHVNDQTVNDEVVAPFGGRGASGTGAFGTLTNLDEFTRWQWVTISDEQTNPAA